MVQKKPKKVTTDNPKNLNLILTLIPIIAKILFMDVSDKCNANCLKTMKSIIENDNKTIFQTVIQHLGLCKRVVELIDYPEAETRK